MNRRSIVVSALVSLVAVLIGYSQLSPVVPTLAEKMPPGALLFVEAANLGGLLSEWSGSREKTEWLRSANYEAFLRSGLLGRLDGASTEFTQASGVANDWNFLTSVAGAQSAMAIYDIGNMKFIYVSRLPSAKLAQSKIWQARTSYSTRTASGKNYFVKSDGPSRRTACLASDGDLLILTTDESLMAATLAQLASPTGSLRSQPWFSAAWNPAEGNSELHMVFNLNDLVKTPHFRSYWVQQNVSQLNQFSAGASSLARQAASWTESRILLRNEPLTAAIKSPLNSLANAMPQNAGFYKAWSAPEPEELAALIGYRLLGGKQQAAIHYNSAPAEAGVTESGNSGDLETRIDDAPMKEASAGFNRESWLRFFARNVPRSALAIGGTRPGPDGVFTTTESAIVIEFDKPLVGDEWTGAMVESMEGLHSVSRLGLRWQLRRTRSNAYQALEGLLPLYGSQIGSRVILSNSETLLAEVISATGAAPMALDASTIYFAQFRHGKERPAFGQLMRMIDSAPTPGALFSENLASLSNVLRRFDSATVVRRDLGDRLLETVTYRIAP